MRAIRITDSSPAPGKSTCPRKLSVPHRVQGYRITDPVALPVRGPTLSWLTAWAYHRITATTGQSMSANQIKGLQVEEIDGIVPANDLALAIKANLSVMRSVAGKKIECSTDWLSCI